jgi:hemolysin activation/secretion protein
VDYLGDSGIHGTFEYRFPSFFFPRDWRLPYSKVSLREQIELVAFVDEGFGRLRGPSRTEAEKRHLLGIGGGLRVRLYEDLYLRTEWGYALGAYPLTDGHRLQFHFRVQYEL